MLSSPNRFFVGLDYFGLMISHCLMSGLVDPCKSSPVYQCYKLFCLSLPSSGIIAHFSVCLLRDFTHNRAVDSF